MVPQYPLLSKSALKSIIWFNLYSNPLSGTGKAVAITTDLAQTTEDKLSFKDIRH